jgi:stage II sporulation protein M
MFLDMRRLVITAIRRTWPLIILVLAVFSLGVVLGIVGVRSLPGQEVAKMSGYVQSFFEHAQNLDYQASRALPGAVFDHTAAVMMMYLLGITVIGVPVILTYILIRGFVLGFALCFLIAEFYTDGLFMAALMILPQNLIFIPAILVGAVTSLWFSLLMVHRFMDSRVRIGTSFVKYTVVMSVVVLVALGAAAVESHVSPWLTQAAAGIINSGSASPGTWLR